ncbi:AAA family ATPase [Candidatus Poribacteria bacterium]|nr:AAA family ATPase [Candidatus Poribacteria bacterium]
MYLKEIYLENTGPISKCHVELPFNEENPLPIVIVGPNGSGKSIFLSYIVDALTEFARTAFRNFRSNFRTVNQHAIRSGEQFSLSLLRFETTDGESFYCEKVGALDPSNYPPDFKSRFDSVWDCLDGEDDKKVSIDKDIVNSEMEENAHAFFSARRYENPDWLYNTSVEMGLSSSITRSNRQLDKPIQVETCASENISWILDVFLDSFINPELAPEVPRALDPEMQLSPSSSPKILELRERYTLGITRQNIESILRTILQDKNAELSLNLRDAVPSRLAIQLTNGQRIPNLQSLSEGQSQLFHLFATIIRYGERADINVSTRLDEITGLVVIDEIDTHLHTTLQHDIVPQLIKLFPKVQFILSSHSPLFLLGMEQTFGADGLAIIELPEGISISSERFTEFGNAFEYYQDTESFKKEIEHRFANETKPLVLTEGSLDARYIQHVLELLGENELINSLDIEFVGIEDDNGKTHFGGDTWLNHFRNIFEANTSLYRRPILLLYDCDTRKENEQVGEDERLWIRSIKQNTENTKVKKGIENLFPIRFFEKEFEFREEYYSRRPKDDGGHVENLDKPKFCEWICKNGNKDDFAKFSSVVDILKEFVEAHQSHSIEQLTTE